MKRQLCLAAYLMLMCLTVQAMSPELTSAEPSMLRLSEAEIASMLGPEELYSGSEIAMWLVTDLLPEIRAEIAETSRASAAEAVKPLLVEIAGLTAERDSALRGLAVARGRVFGAAVVSAVVAGVCGLILGLILAR